MQLKKGNSKTWVEVSKKALFHNIGVFRKAVGKKVKIAAVIKANAYGHDLTKIVPLLKNKVDVLAVDNIDEALVIRQADTETPTLACKYRRVYQKRYFFRSLQPGIPQKNRIT